MDEKDEIKVDPKTQEMLKNLYQNWQTAQSAFNLVVQTIINMNDPEGKYTLSPDFTTLIKVKENKD